MNQKIAHIEFRQVMRRTVGRKGGVVEREDEFDATCRFDSNEAATEAYLDLLVYRPNTVHMVAVNGVLSVYFE